MGFLRLAAGPFFLQYKMPPNTRAIENATTPTTMPAMAPRLSAPSLAERFVLRAKYMVEDKSAKV
jgi:hypothetical protein